MKTRSIIFVIACMTICIIPAALTFFIPTMETTENKTMAQPPEIVKNQELNTEFLEECGDYFSEHMALRNELIYADARIQSKAFHTSSVDSVILGTDGWLYYASSRPDFSGTGLMTERELYNVAHNLEIMQDYLDSSGVKFVTSFPPNKSSLYAENLPYYEKLTESEEHNADLLAPILQEKGISYVNLFELFQSSDEVLYLLRDSHWNLKGAQLAFSELMKKLELPCQKYVSEVKTTDENGDLNRMLYNFYGKTEDGIAYNDLSQNYQYVGAATSTEDGWIVTENETQEHSLLMYRDSFANTLIPFLSNEFRFAYYTKGQPFALENYLESYQPDYVIYEKVERNLKDLLKYPPIVSPLTASIPSTISICDEGATASVFECENDTRYIQISGEISEEYLQKDTEIVLRVNDAYYQAFHLNNYGFVIYLKREEYEGNALSIEVFAANDSTYRRLYFRTVTLPLEGSGFH